MTEERPQATTISRRTAGDRAREWDSQNRSCAEIILADAQRHGGAESLAVRWAHAVLRRLDAAQKGERRPG